MESIKPDELVRAFLDGATDMRTGTKKNPGPLRIMNDKLICFQTVICERFGDKFIINPQFYSRNTKIAQDILLRLIPKDRQILTTGVPFIYWGSLQEYIIGEMGNDEKGEKANQHSDDLRKVSHDCIMLTNKVCFINERRCPVCYRKAKKERIKITQRNKYLLANISFCEHCNREFITPAQFYHLCNKAHQKIKGNFSEPYISPMGMKLEFVNEKYLFFPEELTDSSKYDDLHLPPKSNLTYEMTDEEYEWLREYFQGKHPFSRKNGFPTRKPDIPYSSKTDGLSAEVYYSNEYSANHNICPFCRSVLSWQSVNIPTIKSNGDFYRYYSENVLYCHKCRKAFITQKNIENILKRIQNAKDTDSSVTIKFKNGTLEPSGNSKGYLFNPTLDNSFSIFQPPLYSWYVDYKESVSNASGEMDLNPESFLGEMGYSVNRPENIRHSILKRAVDIHGKRRVADHIAWLISTRKSRANQARAVRIWQGDLNFVTNLIKED